MTISAARLAANQANAAQSTGPRTTEGKARSRANALKHGLCATVVPGADEATVQARLAGVIETVRPQNEYQFWLCDRIAQTTVKLDHLKVIERQTRDDATHRAEFCWDEDQRSEADRIAAGLARNPVRTVGRLRRSLAGCDWLIARWALLADAAATGQPWTDEQRTLAHDLLGTPPEFRANPPTHRVDTQGRAVVPAPSEAELAHARLVELHHRWEQVLDADEVAQVLAMADLDDFGNRDLGRLRRYERALLTDLNTAFEQCQFESPHLATNARLLQAVPAHLRDSAATTPTEPTAPAPIASNEPKPTAPNEPNPAPLVGSNEPKPDICIAPNEASPGIAAAPNEPKTAEPPWVPPGLAGLDPTLAALLEEGMPQPGDLDPDWCREFVAARFGATPSSPAAGPAPSDGETPDPRRFPA